MMKAVWTLCLSVLAGAAMANIGATFSARDGDLHLQTPSESGSLFVNGKSIGEYLGKVDDLASLVATVMQENADLKVGDAVSSTPTAVRHAR
jgi:hypothetical protein